MLRRLSSCRPRPEDSGGPAQPRPHGWSCMAFGVRSNPRQPHQAPLRSWTSPSGDAAPPMAARILCLRLVHLVRRVSTTPPGTPDSLRVGGYPLPDRDFHPARDAKLSWRNNAGPEPRLKAGAQRTLEGVGSRPSLGAEEGRARCSSACSTAWSLSLSGAYNVGPLYPFSSFFSSLRKRQSVP